MTLGEKLFSLRKQFHLTQSAFADAVGVSRSTVSKWEQGHSTPSYATLRRIAAFYDIPADTLAALPGKPTPTGVPDSPAAMPELRYVSLDTLHGSTGRNERPFGAFFAVIGFLPLLLLFLPVFREFDGHAMRYTPLFRAVNVFAVTRPVTVLLVVLSVGSGILQLVGKAVSPNLLPPKKRWLSFGSTALLSLFLVIVHQPVAAILPILLLAAEVLLFLIGSIKKRPQE